MMGNGLTKNRMMVLNAIKDSDTPVHAKEIHELVWKEVNLATIYRSLKFLEEKGHIEGFTLPCTDEGTVRYYFGSGKDHTHFFHCGKCHSFTRLDECSLDHIIQRFEEQSGNRVDSHVMYLIGICRDCGG